MHFIVYDVNRHTRVFQIKKWKRKQNQQRYTLILNCLFSHHLDRFVCYLPFSNG
ncbi:hypothetical protein GHT06_015631 [Daphnia sinensis]|uniref:Uncharacterized protein n=1 Tax=Daphnia sinensis TaxID=1820382 RepID=A0AAD5PTG9_9CRUS|nr:hypothetical protein GHT06_015631 [Daphnia sinensis]